jgi:hypothetical protein
MSIQEFVPDDFSEIARQIQQLQRKGLSVRWMLRGRAQALQQLQSRARNVEYPDARDGRRGRVIKVKQGVYFEAELYGVPMSALVVGLNQIGRRHGRSKCSASSSN